MNIIFFSIIRAHLADLDMNATDYDGKTTNKTRKLAYPGWFNVPEALTNLK